MTDEYKEFIRKIKMNNNKLFKLREYEKKLLKEEKDINIWYHFISYMLDMVKKEIANTENYGDELIFEEICRFKYKHKSDIIWIDEDNLFNTVYVSKPLNYKGRKLITKAKGTSYGIGVFTRLLKIAKLEYISYTSKSYNGETFQVEVTIFAWDDKNTKKYSENKNRIY
jgi:hypothetical protein